MPKKTNGYSNQKSNQRRRRRQYAADDRQEIYVALSTAEKIALISSRRGESKRELARLTAAKIPKSAAKKKA